MARPQRQASETAPLVNFTMKHFTWNILGCEQRRYKACQCQNDSKYNSRSISKIWHDWFQHVSTLFYQYFIQIQFIKSRTANDKRQTTNDKRQTANGKRQTANGTHEHAANGSRGIYHACKCVYNDLIATSDNALLLGRQILKQSLAFLKAGSFLLQNLASANGHPHCHFDIAHWRIAPTFWHSAWSPTLPPAIIIRKGQGEGILQHWASPSPVS